MEYVFPNLTQDGKTYQFVGYTNTGQRLYSSGQGMAGDMNIARKNTKHNHFRFGGLSEKSPR